MRNEQEFCRTADYIANNPIKEGLADDAEYAWWWDEEMHRLKTGATQELGAAQEPSATQKPGATHEPGATEETGDAQCSRSSQAECGTGFQPVPGAPVENRCHTRTRCHTLPGQPHTRSIAAFVKHTNACGVGIADDPIEAYRRAYLGDPNAAMGGILVCDFEVTVEFAEAVMDTYAVGGRQRGPEGSLWKSGWPRRSGTIVSLSSSGPARSGARESGCSILVPWASRPAGRGGSQTCCRRDARAEPGPRRSERG